MSLFFFSKKREIAFPIGRYLRADIHSHILPGVDDGAADVASSLQLLQGMHTLGFETVIGTPHVMVDLHRNNQQTIQNAFAKLKAATSGHGRLPTLYYAAEHMLDEGFAALLAENRIIPYGNSSYVLVETPYLHRPLNLEHLSFQLATAGYKPILAHPERYHYLFNKPDEYEKLKELGFAFQLNALSLRGYYGKPEKEAAQWLVDQALVDYIATDVHHDRHMKHLKNYVIPQKVADQLENLTIHNEELVRAFSEAKGSIAV
jgi:Capsular polysaccharide biosynthesis protein